MSFSLLYNRWLQAVAQIPSGLDWGITLGLLALYGVLALPLGFRLGFFRWQWVRSPATIAQTLAIALVFPALFEESLFRVLLLPLPQHGLDSAGFWGWAGLMLGVFILAHPLNALVFFPQRKGTFFDPVFLTLAGLLGAMCTVSYWQSFSLWPPVAIHWLAVGLWLLVLGGDRRMAGEVPGRGE
jgi:predicted Abi (CAAX) family protease